MTTMTVHALPEAQQMLIDSRLETIERMLMGRVPRADRLAIIEEVELQIYELIGDRDPDLITAEDIVEILRQLDPPEAYLTNDDIGVESRTTSQPMPRFELDAMHSVQPLHTGGRMGGIMGICSIGLIFAVPIIWMLFAFTSQIVGLLIALALVALLGISAGITGLVMSIRNRRQGVLPILGIVTSSVALPIWLFGCCYLLMSL